MGEVPLKCCRGVSAKIKDKVGQNCDFKILQGPKCKFDELLVGDL